MKDTLIVISIVLIITACYRFIRNACSVQIVTGPTEVKKKTDDIILECLEEML